MIINIALIVFIFLEASNVFLLYFKPQSKLGNALGAFKTYPKTRDDESISDFVDYLANWVAGTKLIFICLLIPIVIWGSDLIKTSSLVVLILSIATFYWRLFPLIRKMDRRGEIDPKGYSTTLGFMIAGFMAVFAIAGVISLAT